MTPTLQNYAVSFSETSLNIYQYRQRHIPEECDVNGQHRNNLANRLLFPSGLALPLVIPLSLITYGHLSGKIC
jgi:hypothetical protein